MYYDIQPRKAHEESRAHQRALGGRSLAAAADSELEKCCGVCLASEHGCDSLLGQKLEELKLWYDSGMIGLTPSILDQIKLDSRRQTLHFLIAPRARSCLHYFALLGKPATVARNVTKK